MVDGIQPECTDEELVGQSLAGSLEAFEGLVYRHEARIYRFLCQRCHNAEDARDLTQATFVSAFRHLRQFKLQRSFRSWLFRIARNKSIDFLRSRRVQEALVSDALVDHNDPEAALDQREQADCLWSLARDGLTGDQFDVLWLRYQESLSVREIARALQRTETGVKVSLFRARQRLERLLREQNSLRRIEGGTAASPQPNAKQAFDRIPTQWSSVS